MRAASATLIPPRSHLKLRAVARADEPRPAVLADEERPRGRVRPARRWIGEPRVARRDEHAAARIERIREVVAEPPVLAGGDAGRAALADPADVHGTADRVDRCHVRLAGRAG